MTATLGNAAADLRRVNEELQRRLDQSLAERDEALARETATAEVLRVISGSATDVQPVFEAITARAAKLCEAEFSAVARFEDGLLRLVAVSNLLPDEAKAFHSLFPRQPHRGFVMGRAFVEGRTVHVDDVLADPDYDPRTREVLQSLTGYRTFLGVPMLRDGQPVGVIGCARRAVRPFALAQIELVRTFADQAVIAIENARLLGELQAPHTRPRRIARIPDRDQRRAQRHQPLDRRCATGAGHSGRNGRPALRRRSRGDLNTRGRGLPLCGECRPVQRSPSIGRSCASEPLSPVATASPGGWRSKAGSCMSRTSAPTRTTRCPRLWRPGDEPTLGCRCCARGPCSA